MIAHRCAAHLCPAILPRGVSYCAAHAPVRLELRRAVDARRGTNSERGYDARWRRAAAAFRRRYPICGMRIDCTPPVMSRCYDEDRVTIAAQVDHVIPHKGDPVLFWDQSNWQSLCAACGARKSAVGL